MRPYSNPKKIQLDSFDNINNSVDGSILLSENGLFTTNQEITIPEDTNNFNILTDKKRSINIGLRTNYQSNNTNICIGTSTGDGIGNSSNCIGIGAQNLYANIAGDNNIAIGFETGRTGNTTCSNSISLGYHSGYNWKKSYNVGIGTNSSYGGGGLNTLVITNATAIDANTDNVFFVKPIRALAVAGMPSQALSYNQTTGEWTYNP